MIDNESILIMNKHKNTNGMILKNKENLQIHNIQNTEI